MIWDYARAFFNDTLPIFIIISGTIIVFWVAHAVISILKREKIGSGVDAAVEIDDDDDDDDDEE